MGNIKLQYSTKNSLDHYRIWVVESKSKLSSPVILAHFGYGCQPLTGNYMDGKMEKS